MILSALPVSKHVAEGAKACQLLEMRAFDPYIESLVLEPKTRVEIANEYAVSLNTLKKRINSVKIVLPPGLIFPFMQKEIYYALGIPPYLKTAKNNCLP